MNTLKYYQYLYEFDVNHKVCYICEEEFQNKDKNFSEVKDCCHYLKI